MSFDRACLPETRVVRRRSTLPSRMLSPQKSIHLKTTQPKQVDSQWTVLDINTVGHLLHLFDRLVLQHM